MGSLAKTAADINHEEEKDEEQHFSYAMQLVTSLSLPMVLMAAIRLGLFEIIARSGPHGHLSPSQIAAHLAPHSRSQNNDHHHDSAPMLDRILRLLVSYSVLTCSVDGGGERVYGLAPVAKYFVRNKQGASLGPFLEMNLDKIFTASWYELESAVVEGGVPFNRVHGINAFDFPGRDPRINELFNKAMINHTTIVIDRILECYKGFEHFETLVDVGGGLGIALNAIITKWPNIRGTNFDLPHVIQHAPAYPGVEHVAGDMFESVPKGDAIFMKWILHDWDDDHCLKLLKNCHKALPENGKVIVVDAVLPVIPDTSECAKANCQLDMIMLAHDPGGKERTEQEFLTLVMAAGFRGIRMECFVRTLWVMEFYK